MKFVVAFSALFASVVNAQSPCGAAGPFSVLGSSTVFPISVNTSKAFATQCPNSNISVTSGGSSNGFRAVCAANSNGTPNATQARDIGNMSRDILPAEASRIDTPDQQQFKCILGDTTREFIQLPVAIDGVPLFVGKTSKIWTECLSKQGLTSREARFLYTNDTNITGVFDDTTGHFWNEICGTLVPAKTPIVLVAPSPAFGTNQYFKEVILTGRTEGYRSDVKYYDDNSQALEDAVVKAPYGIGFLGYAYLKNNLDTMIGVPIDGIKPEDTTLIQGTYLPLGRRIYSNFWKGALERSACFAHFHMSAAGQKIVTDVGFLDIPSTEFGFLKAPFKECVAAPTAPIAPTPTSPSTPTAPTPGGPPTVPSVPCKLFCFPWNASCCSRRRARRGLCTCA